MVVFAFSVVVDVLCRKLFGFSLSFMQELGKYLMVWATFIGASQGGFPGALCATLGVVLPAFIIILVIAALIQNLLRFAGVQAFLSGVRPCVVGLILATALTMGLKTLFSFSNLGDNPVPDWRGILLFALMPLTAWGYKRLRKKPLSPILLILLSAGLGMLFYGL